MPRADIRPWLFAFWAFVLVSGATAQQTLLSDEPWETELPRATSSSTFATPPAPRDPACAPREEYSADTSFSPLRLLVRAAIGLYRDHMSGHSISRCPFAVSCSRFAAEAVERHGAVGLLLFIDRYFYREHAFAFNHYPFRILHGGFLKLDDTPYLGD